MSGVQGKILRHLARRGVEYASSYTGYNPQYIDGLQQDAKAYENAGPQGEIKPYEMLPVIITGVIFVLLLASIKYTLGEVVASLAMIESPSSMTIVEPKLASEEPDFPLEKEPFIAGDTDVEITIIQQKPITSKIRATMEHLHRIGGFRARWRGLGLSILYHGLHGVLTKFLARLGGASPVTHSLAYIFVSVVLCRVHMAWTHSMIIMPSSQPWYKRIVPRKIAKAVLLPSLVFATAQQLTIILPVGVGFALGLRDMNMDRIGHVVAEEGHKQMACLGLRFLAVPATGLAVALLILLPAAVTLTRIEASLLSEEEETVVPFDRTFNGAFSPIQLGERGQCKSLFVEAWRSFDRSARLRLIKLYVKIAMIQTTILLVGFHIMLTEMYLIGGERLATLAKAGVAQLRLMAIEAKNKAH